MAISFDLQAYAYAHRGLWSETRPENTLAAFRAASANGLAAECDVHLSSDGEVVVHHDSTLQRLSGQPLRVADMTSEWLASTPIAGTEETIPTLKSVLQVMGQLPLLIELKVDDATDIGRLAEGTLAEIGQQDTPVALMSFDTHILQEIRHLAPDVMLGLLTPPLHLKTDLGISQTRADLVRLNADYIAPQVIDCTEGAVLAQDVECGLASWTVSLPEHLAFIRQVSAAPIFENLDPDLVTTG
ncbi:MAG: hypothetical protein CMK07_02190 [Ponticaulis sp.]|nr:hypothetical protein [Ponticaulis sp.]